MKSKVSLMKVQLAYIVSLVVFIGLAVLALLLMNHTGYQVVSNFLTSNPLASQSGTVFAPASRVVFSFQMRWAVFALLILCMVSPVIYLYQIQKKYKKLNLSRFRTIDWEIVTAFMFILIAVLSGVQDISLLVLSATLVIISYAAGHHYLEDKDHNKKLVAVTFVSLLLPWLMIAVYAFSTVIYGSIRTPWYVYVLYFVGLIRVGTFLAGSQWHKAVDSKKFDATNMELLPIAINQLLKVAFVVVLIIGLNK